MEKQLGVQPGQRIHPRTARAPARTGRYVDDWIARPVGHGRIQPFEQTHRGGAAGLLIVDEQVVVGRGFHLVALRPGHDHRRTQAGKINVRRQQVLCAAGVVSASQIGLPAIGAAVTGGKSGHRIGGGRRHGRWQAECPFVGHSAMGETAIIGLEIGAVHGLRHEARCAGRRWRWLADHHAPGVQITAVAGSIVAHRERPGAARRLTVEPGQPVVEFGCDAIAVDHREQRRDGSLVVEGRVHRRLDARRRGADVAEQTDRISTWRGQLHVQVDHEVVRQVHTHINVGDAWIAGDGQGRSDDASSARGNHHGDIGRRVRRAVDALSDPGKYADAGVIGAEGGAGGRNADERAIGACSFDRREECL